MLNQPLWRLGRQVANVVAATVAVLVVLVLCAVGFHRLPALGRALDPGHGAWLSAAGGQLPSAQKLTLPGLTAPAAVSFDSHGIASIEAASETDVMVALGYTHASSAAHPDGHRAADGRGHAGRSWTDRRRWPRMSSSCGSACGGPPTRNGPSCPRPAPKRSC